ncbi:MAG TPA: FKBP-type peptidyl-prolyl cis-trans isomerase [Chitinophagaceae bacterium]|nr:FKBP-type peptidyl-prolyl cis-trans isomerase [Chitinophagaceae bacterium]
MSIQNKLKQFMTAKIEKQKQEGAAFLEANKQNAGVVELEGGLQYLVLKEGSGNQPGISDTVRAHYKGTLLDGKEFDNSFKRGQPFSAPLRSLIKGWQIALPLMKEGSHWRLWIPSDLAYGDRGAGSDIPGGSTLVFEIELLNIIK